MDLAKHREADPVDHVGEGVVDGGQGGEVAVSPDAREPDKIPEEVVISGGRDLVPSLEDLHQQLLQGVNGRFQGKASHLVVEASKGRQARHQHPMAANQVREKSLSGGNVAWPGAPLKGLEGLSHHGVFVKSLNPDQHFDPARKKGQKREKGRERKLRKKPRKTVKIANVLVILGVLKHLGGCFKVIFQAGDNADITRVDAVVKEGQHVLLRVGPHCLMPPGKPEPRGRDVLVEGRKGVGGLDGIAAGTLDEKFSKGSWRWDWSGVLDNDVHLGIERPAKPG